MKPTYWDPFETRDTYCVITEAILSANGFKDVYISFNQIEILKKIPNLLYDDPDDIVKTTKHFKFTITLENDKEYHIYLDENPKPNQDNLVYDKFILLYKMELLDN